MILQTRHCLDATSEATTVAESAGGIPELRRVFGHGWGDALHAAEQRGPASHIARPARNSGDPQRRYMSEADWAAVRVRQAQDAASLVSEPDLLDRDACNRRLCRTAIESSEGFTGYADAIPPEDELEQSVEYETSSGNSFGSELRRQAQRTCSRSRRAWR